MKPSLSDGEHQFLHSLGLCLLYKNTNSLFLLDEPETHFNPDWRSKVISRLRQCFAHAPKNIFREMLITTHTPFLISDSKPEKVLVFEKKDGNVTVTRPDYNTLGASINKITLKTFGKKETIGGFAHQILDDLKRRFENGEDKKHLLEELDENPDLKEILTAFHYSDAKGADFFNGHVQKIYTIFSILSSDQIDQLKSWYKDNNDLEKACCNNTAIRLIRHGELAQFHKVLSKELASLDPLLNTTNGSRKAFYPYSTHPHWIELKIDLNCADWTSIKPEEIGISAGPDDIKEQISTWYDVYGIEELYKAKCCGENDGKGWIREVVDESQNYGLSSFQYLKGKLKTAKNEPWVDDNFLKAPFLKACRNAGLFDDRL